MHLDSFELQDCGSIVRANIQECGTCQAQRAVAGTQVGAVHAPSSNSTILGQLMRERRSPRSAPVQFVPALCRTCFTRPSSYTKAPSLSSTHSDKKLANLNLEFSSRLNFESSFLRKLSDLFSVGTALPPEIHELLTSSKTNSGSCVPFQKTPKDIGIPNRTSKILNG